MKKVAIITLNHGFNYGNKLQNYAVQRIYEKMGLEVETIRFYPKGLKVNASTQNKNISYYSKRIVVRLEQKIYASRIKQRNSNFERFNRLILKMTTEIYTPENYHTIQENKYDFFSVGSDQVWNTYFFDFTPMYFLGFVHNDDKKIAFAASFGVDDISPKYREYAVKELKKFRSISVREEQGQKILQDIGRIPSTVVLDPTLVLTADDWENVINHSNYNISGPYVVTYFLGGIQKKIRKSIYSFAHTHGYKVISLNDLHNKYYSCGPFDFVRLIRYSEIVFTDSFHATCFSLQFHKPFWVVPRILQGKDMSSRLSSLLNMVELKDRILTDKCELNKKIDFCQSDKILKIEREKTNQFLNRALLLGD